MATRKFLLIMVGGTMPFMYEKQYHINVHPGFIFRPVSEFGNFQGLFAIKMDPQPQFYVKCYV